MKKEAIINVRVYDEQKEQLEKEAKEKKMSFADYIRWKLAQ